MNDTNKNQQPRSASWGAQAPNWDGKWSSVSTASEGSVQVVVNPDNTIQVTFTDGSQHPGTLHAGEKLLVAGGLGFLAVKCIRVVDPNKYLDGEASGGEPRTVSSPHPIEIPTEGEVYEETEGG